MKIKLKYQNLFPRPTKKVYDEMKADIKKHGMHMPIVVNVKDEIIDGYTRFKICKELKIKAESTLKHFENEMAELDFMISSNIHRRDLSPYAKFEAMYDYFVLIRKENHKYRASNKLGKSPLGRSIEHVGQKIGLSGTIVQRCLAVKDGGTKLEIAKLRRGETRVSSTYDAMVKRRGEKTEEEIIEELPMTKKIGQEIPCPECGGSGRITI